MTNQFPSFLTVVDRQVRTSEKTGNKYAYLRVKGDDMETFVLPGGRTITAKKETRETGTIAWEVNNLPTPTKDFGWDLQKGDVVMGSIVTRSVAPYDLDGRTVNTYSCAVFGDTRNTDEFESKVRQAFKNAGHSLEYTEAVALVEENPTMG